MQNVEMTLPTGSIDMSIIAHALSNDGWSDQKIEAGLDHYQKFLTIVSRYPDEDFVPPLIADEVWHKHIERTAKYRVDCGRVFGRPVDHDPDVFGTPEYYATWDRTREVYKKEFDFDLPAYGAGDKDLEGGTCIVPRAELKGGTCIVPGRAN